MTSESDAQRLGRLVRARRKSLRLTQADVQNAGGPSTATLRLIEGGKHTDFRDGTGSALEEALQWKLGSIDNILAGGAPIPLERKPVEKPRLPRLPRGAPNAAISSQAAKALGKHPAAPNEFLPMSSEERLLLAGVRNKIMHSGDDAGFTDEEARLLKRFIEDDELRTLHVRIDWLPRPEQLEVSDLVNKLSLDVENRWVADGYTNESEELPGYAQPNPLPVEGISPSDMGFSVQVPVFTRKEVQDDLEAAAQPATPSEGHENEEVVFHADDVEVDFNPGDYGLAARRVTDEDKPQRPMDS